MRFAIDIVWINNGIVVHIEKDIQPPRAGATDRSLTVYGHGINADMVLEVPAGYISRKKISLGSRVKLISDKE
jgi:uncharacterized membrane protein (UPF0127 family)